MVTSRTTGPAVKVFNEWDKKHPYGYAFSWSHDGTKLAVTHKWDIWVTTADGGKPVQIAVPKPGGHRVQPMWSPDGKMLAYRAYRTEKEQIFRVISEPDGEAKIILDIPLNGEYICAWSPDSKKLAFFSEGVISVFPINSGNPRHILNLDKIHANDVWDLCWSPDSQQLAFTSVARASDSYKIWIIPAEGGETKELATDDPGEKYHLHWSPDGKWLSYNSETSVKKRPEGVIWAADVAALLNKADKKQRK